MMSRNTREDEIFDAILSSAFRAAAAEDIAEIEKEPAKPVELSAKQKRIERRQYNKITRQKKKSTGVKIAQRAVACLLLCCIVCLTFAFSVPTIRADFLKLIAKPFEKYISFGTVTDSVFEDNNYIFKYIPEGFELVKFEKDLWKMFRYENPENDIYFEISYYLGTNANYLQDNEYHNIKDLMIQNNNAVLAVKDSSNLSRLVWSDGKYIFTIIGTIASEEMIKIGNNIIENK